MKYEDKPVDKVNFLPPRKRHTYEQQQLLLHPPVVSEEKKEMKLQEPVKLFKKVENSHIHQQIQNDFVNQPKNYTSYLKSKSHDESFEEEIDEEHDEKLYCICQERYNSNLWMIACDICNNWYHGKCVDVTAIEARRIQQYACPICVQNGQKTLYKAVKKKPKDEQNNFKRPLEEGNSPPSQRRKKVTKVVNCSVACICQNTTITEGQMIQCDKCRSWLHCNCVSVAPLTKNYTCPKCKVILETNGKGNFLSEFKTTSILNKIPIPPSTSTTNGQTKDSTQQQQILQLLPQVKDNLNNTLINNSS